MTLYEHSLCALAHLLSRVGATHEEEHIRSDIDAWRERHDAAQHRRKYAGNSTYSDWIVHRMNGHRVDPVQEVWANELLSILQTLLRELSKDPNSARLERKVLNGVAAHRPLLARPTADDLSGGRRQRDSGEHLRSLRCHRCDHVQASHLSIESVIAADTAGHYFRAAYQAKDMVGMVDTLLDGGIPDLEGMRRRVTRCAEKVGIALHKGYDEKDRCVVCSSYDFSVSLWALRADAELRFESVYQSDSDEIPNAKDEP